MFGGGTFDEEHDGDRLRKQLGRVWRLMIDGEWRSLYQIARETGDPAQSVSARLRDFRKPRFGSHTVERRNIGGGTHLYHLIPNRK